MLPKTVAIFIALVLAGCGERGESKTPATVLARGGDRARVSTRRTGPVRYLALGDSYTIGESIEPGDRWPVRLAERLQREGVDVAPPTIVAVTGYTTGDLIDRLDREPIAGTFDLVSLMIGVNNQYQGRDESEFAAEFDELLRRSKIFAGGDVRRVIIMSIPDWGATPFGGRVGRGNAREEISRPIDRFNAIAHEHAVAAGASWIDVTTATRSRVNEPRMLAGDELHYGRAMHELWAEWALPAARLALGLRDPPK
jgi:lysophospholipase L1-like esterase